MLFFLGVYILRFSINRVLLSEGKERFVFWQLSIQQQHQICSLYEKTQVLAHIAHPTVHVEVIRTRNLFLGFRNRFSLHSHLLSYICGYNYTLDL